MQPVAQIGCLRDPYSALPPLPLDTPPPYPLDTPPPRRTAHTSAATNNQPSREDGSAQFPFSFLTTPNRSPPPSTTTAGT
ncbi:MAG: hypothetical protein WDW38_005793 [Sanguina aurantia]